MQELSIVYAISTNLTAPRRLYVHICHFRFDVFIIDTAVDCRIPARGDPREWVATDEEIWRRPTDCVHSLQLCLLALRTQHIWAIQPSCVLVKLLTAYPSVYVHGRTRPTLSFCIQYAYLYYWVKVWGYQCGGYCNMYMYT